MRAIIVATGRAPRLLPLSKDTPACMLEVGGTSILARQVECLRSVGVDDIMIVVGPHHEQVEGFARGQRIEVRYNPFYLYSHVALSLWIIKRDLVEPFLFLYTDILFGKGVVEGLLEQTGEVSLAVRQGSVDEEAEKTVVKNGLVRQIGKESVRAHQAYGEFIGVARFGETGLPVLHGALDWLAREDLEARFTHLIRVLIERGTQVSAYEIGDVPWIDIDFPEDLQMAGDMFGRIDH